MSRALLLTKQIPWPSDSGGRIREAHVAELLRVRYDEVHVLAFGESPPPQSVPLGISVHAVARPDVLRGALRARSVAVGRWYSAELARRVHELATPGTHVHVGFPHMVVNVRPPTRVASLDLHNVESDLLAQRARRHSRRWMRPLLAFEARRLAAWERRVAIGPRVTCVSEQDRLRLLDMGIRASVARNGAVLPEQVPELPAADTAVFVGALDWAPNVESAGWFCEQVWPGVIARRPGAVVFLVGRAPDPRVLALQSPQVRVAGDVESVAPWYTQSRIAVCPLLTGGGSRLKILEALAYGRPVVSTSLGAEGLENLVGRGVVLADGRAAFADAVVALLSDPRACAELGRTGRAAVAQEWSWATTLAPLAQAVFPDGEV